MLSDIVSWSTMFIFQTHPITQKQGDPSYMPIFLALFHKEGLSNYEKQSRGEL
jgi:hypothetical protein